MIIANSRKLYRLIRNSGKHKPTLDEVIKESDSRAIHSQVGRVHLLGKRLRDNLIGPQVQVNIGVSKTSGIRLDKKKNS